MAVALLLKLSIQLHLVMELDFNTFNEQVSTKMQPIRLSTITPFCG